MVLSKDMQPILGGWGKQFYYNQFKVKIELPTPDKFPSLKGKVAIVTGSNVGLGYEAAKQLLTLGLSRLVVAVRSIERGNDAASKLQLANPKATIDVWLLDMESYESIQAFVRKCDTELSRIDFTILNAGLSKLNFTKTRSTGHELSIQVNHISTALLAILLLPVLKAKSTRDNTARLTVVNSVTAHAHNFTNCNLRPLLASYDDPKITPWQPQDRYRASKLLNQLFLVELTEHVSSDDVIINMVEPGLTKGTGLSRDATGAIRIAAKLFFGLAGRPTEIGAATYTDALLGHGKETHGCFLMNTEIAP
jgi:NAD(P)-dependent dehydrogenase (short-subunit alcohol dehydrogenase family)